MITRTLRAYRPSLLVVIGIACAYGLVLGSMWLAWSWFSRGNFPEVDWWQLAFGPIALGGAAFGLEAAGTLLSGAFGEGQGGQPRRKQVVALVALFLYMAIMLLGYALYHLSGQ